MPKISFVKKTGLSYKIIVALFVIKVIAGLVSGFIFKYYFKEGSDGILMNDLSRDEYKLLITDPALFFRSIFQSNYGWHYGTFFGSLNSYWNDLEKNIIIKMLALFNVLSRGNFFINTLFVDVISFFGHIALYRIFTSIYKTKEWQIIIGCFLLPSTIFFTSLLGKECIVFPLLCLFCYAMFFSLRYSFTVKKCFAILLSLLFLFFVRNYAAVAILPAAAGWIIRKRYKVNSAVVYSCIYAFIIIVVFIIQGVSPDKNPLKIISEKQKAFFGLEPAITQLPTDTLSPTITSFIQAAPQALNHTFLRPYFWDFEQLSTKILSLELYLYWLLFFALLFICNHKNETDPFITFSLLTSVTILLCTGYIVPVIGAIVRYRSVYFPFFIVPLLCSLDFRKFLNKLK